MQKFARLKLPVSFPGWDFIVSKVGLGPIQLIQILSNDIALDVPCGARAADGLGLTHARIEERVLSIRA